MPDSTSVDPDCLAEFEAAARRPLATRWRYAFIRTHRPVLDDAKYRAFDAWRTTGAGARTTFRRGSAMAAFSYR